MTSPLSLKILATLPLLIELVDKGVIKLESTLGRTIA